MSNFAGLPEQGAGAACEAGAAAAAAPALPPPRGGLPRELVGVADFGSALLPGRVRAARSAGVVVVHLVGVGAPAAAAPAGQVDRRHRGGQHRHPCVTKANAVSEPGR
jgi:hypothetical protein